MKTARLYLRVSTTDQADNGVSLDAQQARLREWAAQNGYDAVTYSEAKSGKRADNRPEFQRLLDEIEPGDVLAVYALSRVARSIKDIMEISERLDHIGADLMSVTENFDTTTAAGRMFFNMMAVMAQFERDMIAERTQSAMDRKRAKGERLGQIPYGWRCEDGMNLIEDHHEQRVIGVMRSLRENGEALRQIGHALTGRKLYQRNGKPWQPRSIGRILERSNSQVREP